MRTPFVPHETETETAQDKVYTDLELQQFPAGPFRDLYDYWLGLKGEDPVPSADRFDLLDLARLVADLSVVECEDGRFHVRYSGAGFTAETGRDLTNLYMEDLPGFDEIVERARTCKETGEPYVVMDRPVTWTSRDFKRYSTLVVPFADATGKITCLVYIMTYS